MGVKVEGACLCGGARVSFQAKSKEFDVCHCGMCRNWGGGPAFSVDAEGKPEFTGEELVSVYDSSEWAQRGFCKNCGTHLFYRLKSNGFHNLPLGLLKDTSDFKFNAQIFIDHQPPNYSFADQTEKLTEAQVYAKHSL